MISYKIWDVVMCVVIASLADNDTWEEIYEFVLENYKWFKSFLQMTGLAACKKQLLMKELWG